jgi:hypothetical protein
MSVESPRGRIARLSTFAFLIVGLLALLNAGCRQGMPVYDPTGPNPNAPGTISGTVRGPEGSSAIEGRLVEVVNIDTGERQQTRTSNVGGFTFKVRPGKYRVSVALQTGESILKQPGVMNVNKSDVDAHADFIIGSARVMTPRISSPPNPALGSPIV